MTTGRRPTLPQRAARVRTDLVQVAMDVAIVSVAYASALLFRFGGRVPPETWRGYLELLPVAVVAVVACNAALGLYGRVWQYASILEARRLALSAVLSTALVVLVDVVGPRRVPVSVVLAGGVAGLVISGVSRYQNRLFALNRSTDVGRGLRVVVVGAGRTGSSLVRQMREVRSARLVPVAFVDDDPALLGRTSVGVRVEGQVRDLPGVVRDLAADQVILAIPSAPPATARAVADLADESGVPLRIVGGVDEVVSTGLRLQDVREVRVTDLLGRPPVTTDLQAVRGMLAGRRVLVTGAGGSIGSEICRQVAECAPAALVLLDHDETHLHDLVSVLEHEVDVELADVRDARQMRRVFERRRPEVVFHAAAHKHVPILEEHPDEAVRTNVIGTRNVLAAAAAVGTERFVLISTDKAVRPSSVMGASKAVAELQVARSAQSLGRPYCSVRFGNVLGSRGSVIPTFARQIEAGGPVTVTDPRMTRYFMSIPEAVQLVLESATRATGGDVFMLEMGEPVSILELAKRMVRLSGRRAGEDIEIRVVGPRPGEKTEEELAAPDEEVRATGHPSIVRIEPNAARTAGVDELVERLARLVADGAEDEVRPALLGVTSGRVVVLPDAVAVHVPETGTEAEDAWSPLTI